MKIRNGGVRSFEEILKAQGTATECAKKGTRHKYVRSGNVFNLFYDGEVSGIWRIQPMRCKICEWEVWREELKLIK